MKFKIILFKHSFKKYRKLGIILTKNVQDFTSILREIEDLNKWRNHVYGLGD